MLKVEGKRIGFVLVFCLAFSFFSLDAFAESSTVDNITINVPSSCTLTSSGTGTGETYTVNMNPGQYKNDIGPTTLSVFCNNDEGFSIYAIGFSDDEYGNNKMITTDPDTYIATGTATGANSNDPSNWAMKLTAVTGSGTGVYTPTVVSPYTNFAIVPATYAKVATVASSSTGNTEAAVQANYAVYVSGLQAADTYTGKVKYTVVHPHSEVPLQPQTTQAGQICYYPNGSNVLGSMGCQTVSTSATSATLLASNFSRDGYGFAGWSTTFDYSDSTGFYGPQEYITFTAGTYTGSNPGLSLYAHWIKSAGSLQDWSGCSSLQAGAVTALTDERDDETYAVAKLADGKCWMIENMRIENTDTTGATNIALAQGYETGFTGLANPEAPWPTSNDHTTANSLYSTDGSTENTISGYSLAYRFPRYNNINTPTIVSDRPSNPTQNSTTNSTSGAGMYSYGNYYTWAAATANTTYTPTEDYNTKSICPTGWSLPRGGYKPREATNDFWSLIVTGINGGINPANYDSSTQPYYTGSTEGTLVSNTLRTYPNNFVYSGYVNSSSVNDRGGVGYYWSATTGTTGGFNLRFYSTRVYPGTDNNYKYNGITIRCMVSPSS